MNVFSTIRADIRRSWRSMLLHGLAFALLFQVIMMIALIARFQAVPNYVTVHDWFGNVAWIVKSTPSWRDVPPIIWEEWLIEIGKMNYDYGGGISEWSLNVVPSRLLVLSILGAMLSLCMTLLRHDPCSGGAFATLCATTGSGALAVSMTSATMSWVVCCAAPSWIVGPAMLGLGVSTSLAIESMGPVLATSGFGLISALILCLAWRKSRRTSRTKGAPINA